jgi:WD40 repeat protein
MGDDIGEMKMTTKPNFRFIILVLCATLSLYLPYPVKYAKAQSGLEERITILVWSPDNTKIAIGTLYNRVYMWDVAAGRTLHTLSGHNDGVFSLAWSPDSKYLASGGLDKIIRVWDAAGGKLLKSLEGHTDVISALTWTPNGTKILSGSVEDRQNLRIWDATTGQMLESRRAGSTTAFNWSPDGSKLAITYLATVQIVDAASLKEIGKVSQPEGSLQGNDITATAWASDGIYIATGSRIGNVRIWDTADKQIIADMRANDTQRLDVEASPVSALSFDVDGSKLTSVSADGTLRTWNMQTKQALGSIRVKGPVRIATASWSNYKGRLAFGGNIAQMTTSQTLASDAVQIIAPFPSLEKLQAISKRCAKAEVYQSLTSRLSANTLPDFVSEVRKAPHDQLPPACAADLIALAEGLQKQ